MSLTARLWENAEEAMLAPSAPKAHQTSRSYSNLRAPGRGRRYEARARTSFPPHTVRLGATNAAH